MRTGEVIQVTFPNDQQTALVAERPSWPQNGPQLRPIAINHLTIVAKRSNEIEGNQMKRDDTKASAK